MNEAKDPSRRQAIKYLIGGAMAAACPLPSSLFAGETPQVSAPGMMLGSENNAICHKVRDGASFSLPAPSADYDIVIVGGGPSGLMAGYMLRNTNFIMLEKEPRFGGNAISEKWKDQWYSTGAAYQMNEPLEKMCREIGMEIHRIRSVDAAVINDQLVPEFWKGGLWKSSYPESVKKNFQQFYDDMKKTDLEANIEKLDNMSFADLLKPYGPE